MPTLLLTARQTDDTQKLWRACITENWRVERVHNWRVPSVSVPEAVVVDVGMIRDRAWAVIECNAAWGSGIYGCDPVEVFRVLQRACHVK